MIANILLTLGWLLIASPAIIIVYPFVTSCTNFDPMIKGLSAGIFVALGAQLLSQGKNLRDACEKRSLFYLESCVKAYEEACNLLQDGNNTRTKWIGAGRALVHAKQLSNKVLEEAHQRVLELHRLKFRGCFHEVLADKPAAFFFGASDLTLNIDEAAKLSTAREERNGRVVTSTVHELSEKSLHAVWEAAQWPVDYDDPLSSNFSNEEKAKLLVLFPGLHEHLEHRGIWASASGKLHPKGKGVAH